MHGVKWGIEEVEGQHGTTSTSFSAHTKLQPFFYRDSNDEK